MHKYKTPQTNTTQIAWTSYLAAPPLIPFMILISRHIHNILMNKIVSPSLDFSWSLKARLADTRALKAAPQASPNGHKEYS